MAALEIFFVLVVLGLAVVLYLQHKARNPDQTLTEKAKELLEKAKGSSGTDSET